MPLTGAALVSMVEVNIGSMSDRAVEDLTRNPVEAVRAIAKREQADRREAAEAEDVDCDHNDVDIDEDYRTGPMGRCIPCGALVVDFGEGWESGWLD